MIIDAHTHIHPDPHGFGKKSDASLESLINSLNKSKVDKAIVLPIYPFVSNRFISEACLKYPEKLIGFASIELSDSRKMGKILNKYNKEYRIRGIKIHPRLQKIDPSGSKMTALAKIAVSLNMPILFDCFPQWSKDFPIAKTYPERIAELAQKVPQAKIIIAHAGGHKLWDAFFIARANANIYLDFSFSIYYFKGSSLWQDLGFVLKKIGAKRCIYGSDHPDVSLDKSFRYAKELTNSIGFSAEEERYFFGETILNLLPN